MNSQKRKIYSLVGTISGVGNTVGKSAIDDRWRITLPSDVREGLRPGQVVELKKEEQRVILRPSTNIDEFKAELRGCVRGSRIPPKKLKEIWGISHAHD